MLAIGEDCGEELRGGEVGLEAPILRQAQDRLYARNSRGATAYSQPKACPQLDWGV